MHYYLHIANKQDVLANTTIIRYHSKKNANTLYAQNNSLDSVPLWLEALSYLLGDCSQSCSDLQWVHTGVTLLSLRNPQLRRALLRNQAVLMERSDPMKRR